MMCRRRVLGVNRGTGQAQRQACMSSLRPLHGQELAMNAGYRVGPCLNECKGAFTLGLFFAQVESIVSILSKHQTTHGC